MGRYHEYICPSCATLLQVDIFCPILGGEEDLWDIRIDLKKLAGKKSGIRKLKGVRGEMKSRAV
jgi:hypothetical protein